MVDPLLSHFSGRLILFYETVIKDYTSAFNFSNFINSSMVDLFLLVSTGRISCNVIMLKLSSFRNI